MDYMQYVELAMVHPKTIRPINIEMATILGPYTYDVIVESSLARSYLVQIRAFLSEKTTECGQVERGLELVFMLH